MQTRVMEAPVDLDELAEAARHEPVTVTADGEPAFVAVSPDEYRRLSDAQRDRRREAGRKLLAVIGKVHREIAATTSPEEVERILADER